MNNSLAIHHLKKKNNNLAIIRCSMNHTCVPIEREPFLICPGSKVVSPSFSSSYVSLQFNLSLLYFLSIFLYHFSFFY